MQPICLHKEGNIKSRLQTAKKERSRLAVLGKEKAKKIQMGFSVPAAIADDKQQQRPEQGNGGHCRVHAEHGNTGNGKKIQRHCDRIVIRKASHGISSPCAQV